MELLVKIASPESPFLTMAEVRKLHKQGDMNAFYILNNISRHGRRPAGVISIPYLDAADQPKALEVPITFAPFDLLTLVQPIDSLLNSSDITALVNSEKIYIVKTEIAERALKENSVLNAEKIRASSGRFEEDERISEKEKLKNDVSIHTTMIMEDISLTEHQKLEKLRLAYSNGNLSIKDLEWLLANVEVDSIRKFAQDSIRYEGSGITLNVTA